MLLVLSLLVNLYAVLKVLSGKKKSKTIDIVYDSVPLEDLEQANNILLARGTEQYPEDLLSYLLIVDNTGRITKVCCLDGQYEAIAFNEETEELYLLSEDDIMKIGETISHVAQTNENLSGQYRSDIYMVKDRLYVRSSVIQDERLDFTPVKGYSGYLDMSSIGMDLHMIPIGIVVKH